LGCTHPAVILMSGVFMVLLFFIAMLQQPASAATFPQWRQGLPVGVFSEIPNTANLSGAAAQYPDASYIIDVWNGLAPGPTSWWSAAASGHGAWINPTLKIDFAADAPKWTLVHPGTKASDVNYLAYYNDGLPTSRHTYYTTQFISAAHDRNGLDRVMLFTSYAAYGIGIPNAFSGGPQVDSFQVATSQWDPAGTFEPIPAYSPLLSIAKHPQTEDIYACADYTLQKWTASTGKWTALTTTGARLLGWNYMPSMVDGKRNRLIGITDGRPYYGPTIRLQAIDLATLVLTEYPITGSLASKTMSEGSMLVHDPDNDRYLFFNQESGSVQVYSINPGDGASTWLLTAPGPVYNINGRVAYFEKLGGIAYLPRYSSNVLFLPTTGTATSPVPVVDTVAPTVTVISPVNNSNVVRIK
jgi:hypothetical protein